MKIKNTNNTFVTSDWHLFDDSMAKLRGFVNNEEMLNKYVKNFNKITNKSSLTFFIGDMTRCLKIDFHSLKKVISDLNGRKILIAGNHDEGPILNYVDCGFESVHSSLILDAYKTEFSTTEIVLCHDPAGTIVHPADIWICGHVHKLFKWLTKNNGSNTNCYNACVDINNHTPVSIKSIVNLFEVEDVRKNSAM